MRHSLEDLKSGRLNGFRHVKISEGLTEVPRDIFKLANTLEILDLSGNNIRALPADFARLSKLQILFLSQNDFTIFPKELAECASLTMIGFKANKMTSVPENALPKQTRWLILTDNKLTRLPASIKDLANLQKLMLAGNELQSLPSSIAQCHALELIRISANQLTEFPDMLLGLPKLAWLAFSGNPFCVAFPDNTSLPDVSFEDISRGEILGAGASGIITQAQWISAPQTIENSKSPIAVKTFKGAVTSDGYPLDELAASLAAGEHHGLIPILAKITSGPQTGLAMRLIDPSFINLGQPPSFETCTRDVFPENLTLKASQALIISQRLSSIMVHLRARDICHGDLYPHNILINEESATLLGDFGAASHYASLNSAQAIKLEAIEVRAFGCFLDDILGIIKSEDRSLVFISALEKMSHECLQACTNKRPNFVQIHDRLSEIQHYPAGVK